MPEIEPNPNEPLSERLERAEAENNRLKSGFRIAVGVLLFVLLCIIFPPLRVLLIPVAAVLGLALIVSPVLLFIAAIMAALDYLFGTNGHPTTKECLANTDESTPPGTAGG